MISSKVKTPRTPKQDRTDLKPSSTTHRTLYITIANRFPRPVYDGKVPTCSDSEYTPLREKSLLYTPSERYAAPVPAPQLISNIPLPLENRL
jgi:hypothetical protein